MSKCHQTCSEQPHRNQSRKWHEANDGTDDTLLAMGCPIEQRDATLLVI
jgi:hypothetical protein